MNISVGTGVPRLHRRRYDTFSDLNGMEKGSKTQELYKTQVSRALLKRANVSFRHLREAEQDNEFMEKVTDVGRGKKQKSIPPSPTCITTLNSYTRGLQGLVSAFAFLPEPPRQDMLRGRLISILGGLFLRRAAVM